MKIISTKSFCDIKIGNLECVANDMSCMVKAGSPGIFHSELGN